MNRRIEPLAKGLGWFSIGLGLAEIIAPDKLSQLIGLSGRQVRRSLWRFYGFREVAAGIGILSGRRTDGWMWGRVAGDVVDIVSLGTAMTSADADRTKMGTATAAVLGVTALDVYCGAQLSRTPSTDGRISFRRTIIIDRSPEEVYSFWRKLENLPRFMERIESIEVRSDRLSHWRVRAPAGMRLEWDSEITRDEPNSHISWRSVEGSIIHTTGSVRFENATGGRGTLATLEVEFIPPGGSVGGRIAGRFGAHPTQQAETGLRGLKQILETGDVVRSESSIHPRMHPARPPAESERFMSSEGWRTRESRTEEWRRIGEEE